MIRLALLPLLASLASAARAADPVDCGFWPKNEARYVSFLAMARKTELEQHAGLETLRRNRSRLMEEAYTDLVGDVMAGRLSEDEFNAAKPTSPALRDVEAKIAGADEALVRAVAAVNGALRLMYKLQLDERPFMARPAERNWLLQMAAQPGVRIPVELDAPQDAERILTEQYLAVGLAAEDFQVSCRPRFSPERP